jgi:hypothetical protein
VGLVSVQQPEKESVMGMVERVARALAENQWPVDFPGTKDQFLASHWRYHEDDARAAIEAMMDPSEEMIGAFHRMCDDNGACLVKPGFQAMIKAALEE